MSVNEEFLDEVLGKMLGGGYPWANGKGKGFKYSDSEGFDITEDVEEAKQAILQHFQQEQETTLKQGFYAGQANTGIKLEQAHSNWDKWRGGK